MGLSIILTSIIGFFTLIIRVFLLFFISKERREKSFISLWNDYKKQLIFAWKLEIGLFKSDKNKNIFSQFIEITSRFSWQLLQVIIGILYTTFGNIFFRVNEITFNYGITAVDLGINGAVTIGNYTAGSTNYSANHNNPLFRHEYGHYIQSQRLGIFYLIVVGIPSLQSAILSNSQSNTPSHLNRWFEVDASKKGIHYFNSHSLVYEEKKQSKINFPTTKIKHWTDFPIYIPLIGLIVAKINFLSKRK